MERNNFTKKSVKTIAFSMGMFLLVGLFSTQPSQPVYAAALSPTSIDYLDTGTNGQVDIIRLTFTDVTACAYESDDWLVGVAGSIGVTSVDGIANTGTCDTDEYIDVQITASADVTGGVTDPRIDYADLVTTGSIVADANQDAANFTATDGASPVIIDFEYLDSDDDGKIDSLTLTYSETVVGASVLYANDLIFANDGDFNGALFGTDTVTDLISGSTTTTTVTLGTEATAIDTSEDSSDIDIDTQNTFSLSDGANVTVDPAGISSIVTFTDSAAPVIASREYQDNLEDGSVERLFVGFSENVNYNGNDLGQFAITNNNLSNYDSNGIPNILLGGDGTSMLEFLTSGTTDLTGVSGGTEPVLQYTQSGTPGNRVKDTSANVNELGTESGSTSIDDKADPLVTGAIMKDTGGDGQIDQITLTYTETLANTASAANGFDATTASDHGVCNAEAADPDGTSTLNVNFSCSLVNTAVGDLTLGFTSNAGIKDSSNNQAPNDSLSGGGISDEAKPIIASREYQDNLEDGSVDRLVLGFSENVTYGGGGLDQFFINNNGLTGYDSDGAPNSLLGGSGTSTLTFSTSGTTDLTGVSATEPDLRYIYSANPVEDTSSNTNDLASETGVTTIDDKSVPIITSAAMQDASGSDGQIDRIVLTYTENLADTASAANGFDATSVSNHGTCDTEAANPDGTSTLNVNFSCSLVNTAVGDLTLGFTSNAGIKDSSNNQAPTDSLSGGEITDDAKPILTSAVTDDNSGNGTVDGLTLSFSESVDIADGNAGDGFPDIALTATSGTATIDNKDYVDTGTTSMILDITPTATQNTSLTINPTYAAAGAYDITDTSASANEMANSETVTGTDGANPVVLGVTLSLTGNRNRISFNYSENVTVSNGASTATKGNTTSAGVIAGFGNFTAIGTPGNATVPTGLNTVGGSGTSTLTIDLANEADSYINNSSTTEPSGDFTPIASAEIVDVMTLQVSPTNKPTATGSGCTPGTDCWDLTQPTVTSITVEDAVGSNARIDRATLIFSKDMRDINIANVDADLGSVGTTTGTFTTGTANDDTTVFNRTDDNAVGTAASFGDFTYSGATTFITDRAGNLLDTLAVDGEIASDDVIEVDSSGPMVLNIKTQDADGNGKIDHLQIEFSEAIDDSAINNYDGSTDYLPASLVVAIVNNEKVEATEGVCEDDAAEDDQYLCIIFDEDAGTCDATDQTGCDTGDTDQDITWTGASITIQDSSTNPVGNLASGGIVEADGVAPLILSRVTKDTDANDGSAGIADGQIDGVLVTFTEAMDHLTVTAPADFTVTTSADGVLTEAFDDPADDNTLFFRVTNGTADDTSDLLKIDLSGGDGIQDLNGLSLVADVSPVSATDGAGPYLISATYSDSDVGNKVDQITLIFTEVTTFGMAGTDWDFTTPGDVNLGGDFLIGDCTGSPGATITCTDADNSDMTSDADKTGKQTVGGNEPVWSYIDNASNVHDGTNATGSFAATLIDGAAPVVITRTTKDTDANDGSVGVADAQMDGILAVFSEAMDYSTVANNDYVATTNGGGILTEDFTDSTDDIDLFFRVTDAPAGNTSDLLKLQITGGDGIQDLAGVSVISEIAAVAAVDGAVPILLSTALNYDTNALALTFTEAIDATPEGNVDLAKIHINNATGVNLPLSDLTDQGPATVSPTDNATLGITITTNQSSALRATSSVTGGDLGENVLDLEAGAVIDMSSNANLVDLNNSIAEDAMAGTYTVCSTCTYTTIQSAIDAAIDSDTVSVLAGTYTEGLTIDKGLTIQGASTANVTVTGTHTITADNVAITGFTFDPNGGIGFTVDASGGNRDNISFTDNIFDFATGSPVGISLGGAACANQVSNIAISRNTFDGPAGGAVAWRVGGTTGLPLRCQTDDIDFQNNAVNYSTTQINLHDQNINDVLISNNTFRDTDGVVYIWGEGSPSGALSNFVFTNNNVDGTNSYGVGIDTDGFTVFGDANFGTGNTINNNNFSGITSLSSGFGAVSILSTLTTYSLDADHNWWGDASGPGGSGPGIGSLISADVNYAPYFTNASQTILNTGATDAVYTSSVQGQAEAPAGVTDIELTNSTSMDVSSQMSTESGGSITVAGTSQSLSSFTSGDLTNKNLTSAQTIGSVTTTIKQAVKLESGVDGEPLVISNSNFTTATVSIPDETVIFGPAGWNGKVAPPKTGGSTGTAPSNFTLGDTIVEVGSPNGILLFDKPVSVIILGTHSYIGYKPATSTVWTRITQACGGTYANPIAPGFPGVCFISESNLTKIYTYHLTTFGNLSSLQTIVPSTETSSGGGGGGGGSMSMAPPVDSNTKTSTISSSISQAIDMEKTYSRPLQISSNMIVKDAIDRTKTTQITVEGGFITLKPNSKSTISITIPENITLSTDYAWDGKIEPPLLYSTSKISTLGGVIVGSSSKLKRENVIAVVKVGSSKATLNFSGEITVEVPLEGAEDGEKVSIYSSPYGNKWTLEGKASAEDGKVLFYTDHFSYFAIEAEGGLHGAAPITRFVGKTIFNDIYDHWAETYINKIASLGIVSGKQDGVFAPNDNITRAEMTKIAVNAFGFNVPETVSIKPFPDVETNVWYTPYIQVAKENGIVRGIGGEFKPNEPVSRAAALKIIIEAADFDGVYENYQQNYAGKEEWWFVFFSDVPIGEWYSRYVAYAKDFGIVGGYEDETFRPANPITRAEVAKIVMKVLDLR